MLIEKPIDADDVISIKLVTGEEVIARFAQETATDLVVERPMSLGMSERGLQLMRWIVSSDSNRVKIKLSAVMAYSPTTDALQRGYLEQTSGIKIVA